ncbi:MAG: trimethylamine methyltransferase family protein [Pseudomonadota bacterium]
MPDNARKIKRRKRRVPASRSESPKGPAPAYIKREIPFYEFLSEGGLVKLEEQADWLIQEIGLEFREDPVALEIWKKAGADVDGTRVRLPAGAARELCKTAPSTFTQHARNPARSIEIGGKSQVYAPVFGPPFVRDLEGGRRYATMDDHLRLTKICHSLDTLHNMGLVICEPCDKPVSKRHLDMLYHMLSYSDKPCLGAITEMSRAQDSVDAAKVVFGEEFMREHCVIMGNVNTNSPLLVDRVVTQAAQVYSGAGQGLIAAPFILSGAMGPVTTAASIAQALAEAMMICAFTQLIKPGSPFILGNFLSSMSLRTGAPTFGTPEPMISNLVIGQLARRLNVPLRCGGSLTSSKLPDAQAAAESADSMLTTVLGGANFVIHAAGWLEGGLVSGYEKIVQDADRLGGYQVMLDGLKLDDNALARGAYHEVQPSEHFLGCAHTMENYQTAFYEAQLSNNEAFEQWEENGSKNTTQAAYERWNKLLDEYERPSMDDATHDALVDFVERRKTELPDAWY